MTDTTEDLNWRNLFRMRILEVADALDGRTMTASEGAAELRRLSNADIKEMDEADIEIDFDTGSEDGEGAKALLAMGSLSSKSSEVSDPLETALSRVISLRDRNNSLKIVAEDLEQEDIEKYRAALGQLQSALNNASFLNQK